MNEDTRSLYLAIIFSIAAIFLVNVFLPSSTPPVLEAEAIISEQAEVAPENISPSIEETSFEKTETIIEQDRRVDIDNSAISGSLRLKGARIDHILLKRHKETLDPNSADVELLFPGKTENAYYADFGWTSNVPNIKLPTSETLWSIREGSILTPDTPVILEWNNGQGLNFIRKISIDDNYMFNIENIIENSSNEPITLYPYGLISKIFDKSSSGRSVIHQGISGVLNGVLEEFKYKDLAKTKTFQTSGGWAGFSEHYWFSAFILNNKEEYNVKFSQLAENKFQADYIGAPIKLSSNDISISSVNFFAGAKEIKLLDEYAKQYQIPKFDLAVDFGWYYFLTKPFFYILDFLYEIIGNMGWAILLFAAILRLLMFPIANKSYENMSKMKKVQPKLQELQKLYAEDKQRLQVETMALYKKEKINPASGCLPMLIQIPVFFSLYKVLNFAIEIRHAPFVGWIKDLSAPDPLTISALLHIPVPSLLNIGVWPILMGLTMFMQQKLSPAPTNKDQARAMALMPLIFTFMLGHFAAGLVIYWTLSNMLSIIQQRFIMRKYQDK